MADLLVSFVAGIAVFSVLGNMAYVLGEEVSDVASAGFALAFITYPESVTLITFPHLWAIAFFAMLFFLAVDSEFGLVEGVLTPLKDAYPVMQEHLTLMGFLICTLGFILGVPMTTRGGMYILNLLDTYIGGQMLFFIAVFESISVSLIYGVQRLSLDIEFMLDRVPGTAVRFCWQFVCPIVLTVILTTQLFTYSPMTFGTYVYPRWAQVVAVVLVLGPVIIGVAIAIHHLLSCGLDLTKALQPRSTWGPRDPDTRRDYEKFLALRGYSTPAPPVLPLEAPSTLNVLLPLVPLEVVPPPPVVWLPPTMPGTAPGDAVIRQP
ncbi:sodium- and chloride-dependent glycine transporter 2-like [Dermacentor silvarum]|uniref:sodium- and chloride-dependent glycine transporter 2-like n=1 Tax=Dermacentor silvarum TaxID=543639 RepID=UPI00189744DC|nr:sodium- and chloride-dependent glycine transporter 2-like [Dermacentor silvarum]